MGYNGKCDSIVVGMMGYNGKCGSMMVDMMVAG